MTVPPAAVQATAQAVARYEPEAVGVLVASPKNALSVLLEAARRGLEAATPLIRADERERIARMARRSGDLRHDGKTRVVWPAAEFSEMASAEQEAATAERERIAKLSERHGAICVVANTAGHPSGFKPFADLIREEAAP